MSDEEENTNENAGPRRDWCVVHAWARAEKQVDAMLARDGRFHYLPLYRKMRLVNKRKVYSMLPLFPGYVFSRLSAQERFDLRQPKKVIGFLNDPNPRKTIHQLRQVKRALRGEKEVRIAPLFTTGTRVRVKDGDFRGLEGIIVRDGGKTSIALNVTLLGCAAVFEIDANKCEAVCDAPKANQASGRADERGNPAFGHGRIQ